jgi:Family of unknown function (DUF6594)
MTSPPDFYTIPNGYPRLAAFICKDQDWNIFQKFKALNVRNLLYIQREVWDLEAQLKAVDDGLQQSDGSSLRSWLKFSSDKTRLDLVKQIRTSLAEYSKFSLICDLCYILMQFCRLRTLAIFSTS